MVRTMMVLHDGRQVERCDAVAKQVAAFLGVPGLPLYMLPCCRWLQAPGGFELVLWMDVIV